MLLLMLLMFFLQWFSVNERWTICNHLVISVAICVAIFTNVEFICFTLVIVDMCQNTNEF